MDVSSANLLVPDEFQKSYLDLLNYPTNIILRGTNIYHSVLQSLKDRLDQIEPQLCLSRKEAVRQFEVPIRDLHTALGKDVEKANNHSPEKLSQWLGTNVVSFEKQQVQASRRDSKCRFIYIYSHNSSDRLLITRSSLAEVFTYHQVMPAYLDFIFVFGAQSDATDLRFTAFRHNIMMRDPPRMTPIPQLGRSGRCFQLCYNLKGAAIYHQFDVVYGTTLWIVTKGRLDLQQRFKELTGKDGRPEDKSFDTASQCLRSSLAAHLLYCYWSTESWRWYVRWMEEIIENESAMAIYGPRGPGFSHMQYKPHHIQDLQYWLDKASEAVTAMESNVNVISAMRNLYASLSARKDFPEELKEENDDDLIDFDSQLDDLINDFNMQLSRARLLVNITRDRKDLVSQHLNGQAAERTKQLNINLERDAIGMRVITIVTLVYLPATFVSTVFGTDVVKYQNDNAVQNGSSGSFSSIALTRWLQVTIPLTVVTLVLAWATFKVAHMQRRLREMRENPPGQTLARLSSITKSSPFNDQQ
ncbi:hypothetical protein AJ79_00185 [Helicocarpus griseus UAMH5409]|uniref:CorA-like transporter domain-containing protein n=1 Tax=Helicocarpus griseus UAMH5409 TaxID=1447875 RepID=A0A2B7YD26_9EURO|nr:hypothetical protein AJ79_00185 [Helicocarpus griseus UAMH5409]